MLKVGKVKKNKREHNIALFVLFSHVKKQDDLFLFCCCSDLYFIIHIFPNIFCFF